MKIISWNINGIRAIEKKGFKEWLLKEAPDILGVQEIKAKEEQIPQSLQNIGDYHCFWNPAERKGYSGVGVFSKLEPNNVFYGFGNPEFDVEGRSIALEFDDFIFYNIYFPNGQRDEIRLRYKLAFYDAFLEHVTEKEKDGKHIIICGDVNTAHKEIDLARPKQNENVSGFLQIERDWLDKLISSGFIDTFREFSNEADRYSWWNYRSRARDRNVGWRIDYFFISENMRGHLSNAFILDDIFGSDHCPVGIEFN